MRFKKAVGIIASASKTTLKLITTALGEPKLKNSTRVFFLLILPTQHQESLFS